MTSGQSCYGCLASPFVLNTRGPNRCEHIPQQHRHLPSKEFILCVTLAGNLTPQWRNDCQGNWKVDTDEMIAQLSKSAKARREKFGYISQQILSDNKIRMLGFTAWSVCMIIHVLSTQEITLRWLLCLRVLTNNSAFNSIQSTSESMWFARGGVFQVEKEVIFVGSSPLPSSWQWGQGKVDYLPTPLEIPSLTHALPQCLQDKTHRPQDLSLLGSLPLQPTWIPRTRRASALAGTGSQAQARLSCGTCEQIDSDSLVTYYIWRKALVLTVNCYNITHILMHYYVVLSYIINCTYN